MPTGSLIVDRPAGSSAGLGRVDPITAPLAVVPRGGGNDGHTGTEGAVQGTIVGTYLHGPVIPVNPEFADTLLARALQPVTGGGPLEPLDDGAERRAHLEGLRRQRGPRGGVLAGRIGRNRP